jgi:hypothetical protein
MGQLAGRREHVTSSGSTSANHAIWLSIAMVRRGSDAAESLDGCATTTADAAAETRSAWRSSLSLELGI